MVGFVRMYYEFGRTGIRIYQGFQQAMCTKYTKQYLRFNYYIEISFVFLFFLWHIQ